MRENSTTWAYDRVGNRNPSNTYNCVDELNPGSGYIYDMLGNVEHKPDASSTPRTDYLYTDDNLLKQVDDVTESGTGSATMTWDADQQRVKISQAGWDWRFIYDPTASIPAVLFADTDLYGTCYYVGEPGGELIARQQGSTWHYYHFDALGSTRLLTDAGGSVTDRDSYDPWGSVISHDRYAGSIDQPYQYVGQSPRGRQAPPMHQKEDTPR